MTTTSGWGRVKAQISAGKVETNKQDVLANLHIAGGSSFYEHSAIKINSFIHLFRTSFVRSSDTEKDTCSSCVP